MITNAHHINQRTLVRLLQELDYTETDTYRMAHNELMWMDDDWRLLQGALAGVSSL